jgi:hypothetical protein
MDTSDKPPNQKLTSELTREGTETAKEADVSISVIASQLRVAITYKPHNDWTFKDLSCGYHGLFNEVAPRIRDHYISTVPCCTNKLQDMIDRNRTITAGLMKDYCSRKEINKTISAMKKEKKLPGKEGGLIKHTPNYSQIQKVFLENGLHVDWEMKMYNNDWWRGTTQAQEKIVQDERDYLVKMLKEIIKCDYEKRDYQRKDRNEGIIRMGQEGEELFGIWPCSMWHICLKDYYREYGSGF